jgi:hypothetical protein
MVKRKGIKVPLGIGQYLSDIGKKGGKASARKLTKAQRSARARKAVQAREAQRKGGKR